MPIEYIMILRPNSTNTDESWCAVFYAHLLLEQILIAESFSWANRQAAVYIHSGINLSENRTCYANTGSARDFMFQRCSTEYFETRPSVTTPSLGNKSRVVSNLWQIMQIDKLWCNYARYCFHTTDCFT